MNWIFRISIIYLLVIILDRTTINGQVLQDTASLSLISKGVDYTYNCQFDEAEVIAQQLSLKYPEHAINYLFRGMIAYWKFYPIFPTETEHITFEADLNKCIELCENQSDSKNSTEFLLIGLCARGLLLNYYANNGLDMQIVPLAKATYVSIRKAFNYTSVYTDFYFFTGLYNYYRVAYPEVHGLYKPIAFFFPKGNKEKGRREIEIAAKESIFLKGEASSLLSWINISYENDYQKAFNFSESIQKLYPENPEFLGQYIKNLLLIKKYDEAEQIINSTENRISNSYYQSQISIFNAILQEKKYLNYDSAEQLYKKGIIEISAFGVYGNEFSAYAYFGLSRHGSDKANKQNRKYYRKKANDLAVSKKVDFDN